MLCEYICLLCHTFRARNIILKVNMSSVRIQEGYFTDILTTNNNAYIKRQYKKVHPQNQLIYAFFLNEWMVFKRCNHVFVHSNVDVDQQNMCFLEERAIMDLFDLCQVGDWRLHGTTVDAIKNQLMLGLQALHEQGIMCIDLKLENVLVFPYHVEEEGVTMGVVCKLSDFNMVAGKGLLITEHRTPPYSKDGLNVSQTDIDFYQGSTKRSMGTYIAPEEYPKSPRSVGLAADLFRFGIMMLLLRYTMYNKKESLEKMIPYAKEGRTFQWASELHGIVKARNYVDELDYLSPDPQKRVDRFQEEVPQDLPDEPVYFLNEVILDVIKDFVVFSSL